MSSNAMRSPRYMHHAYMQGTYAYAGAVMCATCGLPPGAAVHVDDPKFNAGEKSTDAIGDRVDVETRIVETAAALDDVESDHRCLDHLQAALKELILALNMEPDSYEIAQAVMTVQCAVSCMRSEVKYQMPDDDVYETPAITDAAQVTLEDAGRYFSDDERKRLASTGHAMKDGSFPITNRNDLKNAIHLAGHATNPGAAKAHIKKMAAKLGASDMIPKDWAAEQESEATTEFIRGLR